MKKLCFSSIVAVAIFTGCVGSKTNISYEQSLINKNCDANVFEENIKKIEKNDDIIYVGLNSGLVARTCNLYEKSNYFFDAAEESYKNDVDLESAGKKVAKVALSVVANPLISDYDGSMHERIMVNVYKSLNFMALGNYEDARVEINRALLRQEKAKDYFAKQIAKNKEEIEKQKNEGSAEVTAQAEQITKLADDRYNQLFESFEAQKNFTNPYASYIASAFYMLEGDYASAVDKFKEILVTNKNDKAISKMGELFEKLANSTQHNDKYILLAYEDGLGAINDSFDIDVPFIEQLKLVTLPTLKKREASFENVSLNGTDGVIVANFDNIIATEFKTQLPSLMLKTIISHIIKAVATGAVAKNDSTGGFLTAAVGFGAAAINKTDTRSWMGLPKTATIALVKNDGTFNIKVSDGSIIKQGELDKDKNALIIVRSYKKDANADVYVLQK